MDFPGVKQANICRGQCFHCVLENISSFNWFSYFESLKIRVTVDCARLHVSGYGPSMINA